jgi:hypothetical protein
MGLVDDGVSAPLRRDRPRGTRSAKPAPPADETFHVAEHNIEDVKAYVNANPDKVGAVLGAERRTSEPRSTLIEWLESKQDSDNLL